MPAGFSSSHQSVIGVSEKTFIDWRIAGERINILDNTLEW
jgi:hypothetical protein